MRDDQKPHRGLWHVMQVDSGIVGIIVAAGFVVLALVGMPTIAPVFLLATVPIALVVVVMMHFSRPRR